MLVIVHHGDVQLLLQPSFNLKTFRCLDVLQVDTAKSGGYPLDRLYKLIHVLRVHLNVKNINIRKYLNRYPPSPALPCRLISQPPNCSSPYNGKRLPDYP